ncbi:MAG TPA: hypothetical protein VH395_01795 [Jatrophihabitantaceae bacterium]|jgi:hypothetical protein
MSTLVILVLAFVVVPAVIFAMLADMKRAYLAPACPAPVRRNRSEGWEISGPEVDERIAASEREFTA